MARKGDEHAAQRRLPLLPLHPGVVGEGAGDVELDLVHKRRLVQAQRQHGGVVAGVRLAPPRVRARRLQPHPPPQLRGHALQAGGEGGPRGVSQQLSLQAWEATGR